MAYEPHAAIFHTDAPVRIHVARTPSLRRSRVGLALAAGLAVLLALAMPGEVRAAQPIAVAPPAR